MKWADIEDIFAFTADHPGIAVLAIVTLMVGIFVVAAIQTAAKGSGGWKPVIISSAVFLILVALGAFLSVPVETDVRKLTLDEWFE